MTTTNEQTYAALKDWLVIHHYAPSVRELAGILGIKPTPAYARLMNLVEAGVLDWPASSLGKRQAHTMRLVEERRSDGY